MRVFPIWIKHPLDVPVQRPHHAYAREHRRATQLGNQYQRFHRSLPFNGVVLGLRQLGDA
jgi:hypothetical protein